MGKVGDSDERSATIRGASGCPEGGTATVATGVVEPQLKDHAAIIAVHTAPTLHMRMRET